MPAKKKQPAIKIPKTLGACADKLYQLKEKKSQAQKVVDAIAEEEKAIREHVINNLPKSDASGIAGKLARVTVVTKEVPQIKDWPKFYNYVKRNNAFELLQKRLSNAAIQERLDDKKKIPGLEIFKATTVSLNKV